jgi:hypothetical protein
MLLYSLNWKAPATSVVVSSVNPHHRWVSFGNGRHRRRRAVKRASSFGGPGTGSASNRDVQGSPQGDAEPVSVRLPYLSTGAKSSRRSGSDSRTGAAGGGAQASPRAGAGSSHRLDAAAFQEGRCVSVFCQRGGG